MKTFFQRLGTKNIIIVSGIMLVGVAVFLNVMLGIPPSVDADEGGEYDLLYNESNQNDQDVLGQSALVNSGSVESDSDSYFASAQVSRARARDEAIETLQQIVDSPESGDDIRESAFMTISLIALDIETEANIETLVKAKGFEDCVAVISGETANIIVKSNGLLPNEVAQIKEIVYEATSILPANVKIVEKAG